MPSSQEFCQCIGTHGSNVLCPRVYQRRIHSVCQPSRRNLLLDVSKASGNPPDVGGLAANSELRFQDALPDQRSRRVAADKEAHGSPEGGRFITAHALRVLIGFPRIWKQINTGQVGMGGNIYHSHGGIGCKY